MEVRGTASTVCIFDPVQPLRLWLDSEAAARAEVLVDGSATEIVRYQAPEILGEGLRISLSASAHELELRVPGTQPWTLQLQATEVQDEFADEVAVVDDLRNRAILAYADGNDWRKAMALAKQAIQHARGAELTSKAVDAAQMSAFFLGWHVKRPDLARELLAEIHEVAARSPQGRADWEVSSGHVLWSEGDVSNAAQAYRLASRYAVRMEDRRLILEAMPMYAAALAELGYFRAAAHWSGYALGFVEQGSESHGQVLETAGWVNLVLRRDGHDHVDPVALYESAVRIFGPGGSFPSLQQIGPAQLGLAEARLLDDEPQAALALLEEVNDEHLTPDDRAYRHDLGLRARLRLGGDDAELEAGLAALERAVALTVSPEPRWWLAMRRGDLHARSSRWEQAIAAFREAEERLDELAQLAAFGVGRTAVGESHHNSSIRLAEALLELGRSDEALCALREAEGRRVQLPIHGKLEPEQRAAANAYIRKKLALDDMVLRSIDGTVQERRNLQTRVAHELERLRGEVNALLHRAGRQWDRPRCSELSPRRDGELILGLYPGRDVWLVFVQDEDGTTALRLPGATMHRLRDDHEQQSDALLGPIGTRLERAQQLRVLAGGRAKAIDVQTLPWRGRPLLETITVVYGAEVVVRPRREWPARPTAVLIADPTRTLPAAEQEISTVARLLEAAGYSVDMIPQDDALPAAARRAIEGANLMHFSGHSQYPGEEEHGLWPPYAGGTPGMASHLVLAGGQPLAIHDISLLGSVPDVVVLEGCEAGSLDPGVGGMSLALAFIAGGSSVAIASPDQLRDDLAAMLGREFYADVRNTERFDAAQALRRAQRKLWDEHPAPESHIGRYRAWVP